MAQDECIYRINCGSDQDYTDNDGNCWSADHKISVEDAAGKTPGDWFCVGGNGFLREADLPIFPASLSELIRTECCGLDHYHFNVPNGQYTLRLIVGETFECLSSFDRSFTLSINGEDVGEEIKPFDIAKGFARAGVITMSNIQVTDAKLLVHFGKKANPFGLELIRDTQNNSAPPGFRISKQALAPYEPSPIKHAENAKDINMLIIGHSGTFFWAIPETTKRMIELVDPSINIHLEAVYKGGKDCKFFYESEEVDAAINKGSWDYIVIQDSSMGPFTNPDTFNEYMPKLIEKVRSVGAIPLLYAYNVSQRHTPEDRQVVVESYNRIAKDLQVAQMPCVRAIQMAFATAGKQNYNNPDRHHTGMLAGYISALVWYRSLTGKSAHSIKECSALAGYVMVPEQFTEHLAKIADAACAEYDDAYLQNGIFNMEAAALK